MVEAAPTTTRGQTHLMTQDAKTVDPTKLTALTPEVVSCVCGNMMLIFTHPSLVYTSMN